MLRPDLHDVSRLNAKPTQTLLDAREQFAMGPPSDAQFKTPQLGEEYLPGFNTAISNAYKQISDTCCELVYVIEEGLDAPRGCISGPAANGQGAELNLNFYPEIQRHILEDRLDTLITEGTPKMGDHDTATMRRIWPHTDLGVVSALFQDGIGESGLEIQLKETQQGEFAPVPVDDENDLVLLVSDTLERWTNGELKAAVHRVSPPPAISQAELTSQSGRMIVPKRRSAVMFFRAPPTVDLYPLSYFISPENPAKYEHITAGKYLQRHNERLY